MVWKVKEHLFILLLMGIVLSAGGCGNDTSYDYNNPAPESYSSGISDDSFGIGGIVTTEFGRAINYAKAGAIQADGRIVVLGVTGYGPDAGRDFALARYNVNGTLDDTFGEASGAVQTGMTTTSIEFSTLARDVTILENGKILAVGNSSNGWGDYINALAFARYKTDGSLDTTFGVGGKVMTSIDAMDMIFAVDIYYRKILAVGRSNNGSATDFALVRYTADGTLDIGFGSNGMVSTSFGDCFAGAYDVVIQKDGKIIAVGGIAPSSSDPNSTSYFALARYKANGTLDTSFGSNGLVKTPMGSLSASADKAAIQADGKIIVFGGFWNDDTLAHTFALVRYNPDGSLDTTFGPDGIVTLLGVEGVWDGGIAIQSDGKIVVTGASTLVRFNPDGSLDNSFGSEGRISMESSVVTRDIFFDSNGRIVVVGKSSPPSISGYDSYFYIQIYK